MHTQPLTSIDLSRSAVAEESPAPRVPANGRRRPPGTVPEPDDAMLGCPRPSRARLPGICRPEDAHTRADGAERERRAAAAARLGAEHGPFTTARVEARSAISGVAVAHGTRGELRIDFQLHPLLPPRVQHYRAEVTA